MNRLHVQIVSKRDLLFSSPPLLSSLELSDTQVEEPSIRALLGIAAPSCGVVVKLQTRPQSGNWTPSFFPQIENRPSSERGAAGEGSPLNRLCVGSRSLLSEVSGKRSVVEAMGAIPLLDISDSSFTCEDYNTYSAHPWSLPPPEAGPSRTRSSHPSPERARR